MSLIFRLLTPTCSRQVIQLRTSFLRSNSLFPRLKNDSKNTNCLARFVFTSAGRRAGSTAVSEAAASKPKLKTDEVKRLLSLAKPEKYRLAGH